MISYEEFKKVELRTAKILLAERVEGYEKLIKLKVAANLEPKTMMGLESQGMLLAAEGEEGSPVLLTPDSEVPPGSEIS